MPNTIPDQERFEQARHCFALGVTHFEAGRWAEAERCFLDSLQQLPDRASTRINLAATWLQAGRLAEALAELDRVLAAEPQHADAWCHRAAALSAQGRFAEALSSAEKALAIDPHDGTALWRCGQALGACRRYDEAEVTLARLLALQPGHAEAWFQIGQLQQRRGRLEEALRSHERALALAPTHAAAHSQRGTLLRELGRADEAATAFERAMALGADTELHRFYIAALGRGGAGPARAPQAYVQALFDDYADGFDNHLVQVLGYQAHQRLVAALAPWRSEEGFASALDLGCGTGLCGPLLRPQVRHLQGVDLSQPMLDRAAALGVYDRLHRAELVEHLRHSDDRHDLVIAADVFIYIGALEAVFEGARRVLRPGGVFAFSVEQADATEDVALTAHLRYAHARPYLQQLAQRHGFQWLRDQAAPIRQDQRTAIAGLYVVLRRS